MNRAHHWPGVVLDIVLVVAIVALAIAHAMPNTVVVGFLGSLIGARVAGLRASKDEPPPSAPPPRGGRSTRTGEQLRRLAEGSAVAALLVGLVALFWHRHEA